MVVLGCQYNVGGTMDAATFLTALCENKLPCTKLRACMASERSKNMRPQKPPTLPEAENPIQAGVSGPEQGGMVVPQESTSTAAPSTSAPTAAPPEEVSTASVATVPPSTSAAPPDDPPPAGEDEGSREDEPSFPVVTAATTTTTTSTEPPPAPTDVQPPPDDPLPAPTEEVTGGDEMSFYPCLCARKAKYRGLLWKPRMNSRRTRAITWKDYNFIFPLSVVRECLVASY
ncbi:uncharacterized protein LOC119462132 [Dermacentor silvarum]|uniref:uncharacterized protein LOC119462132 n=1 Tax=Dermacentor silvarum TaxID=543639 RepID=UPI002101ACCB|nr:uncharacterized protein LOC119462132 [Dermacentor silvarum]